MLMGYRQYARHRGVSLRAVQKAIEANRISITAEKKIDSEVADRDWDANTDSSRVAMNVLEGVKKNPPQPAQAADIPEFPAEGDDAPGSDQNTGQYREHRATREQYLSLMQKLEYEQMIGKLIDVDDAKRVVYTSFRGLRDSIMNVAARLKDQLAAETDAHACELLLENELSAALAGIDIGKLLKEQEDE